MLEYCKCPTCAYPIGELYPAFLMMKEIYFEKNKNTKINKFDSNDNNITNNNNIKFSSNFTAEEILNELKISNICCRTRMLGSCNFYETCLN